MNHPGTQRRVNDGNKDADKTIIRRDLEDARDLARSDVDGAVHKYKAIIEAHPNCAKAYHELTLIYIFQKDHEQAYSRIKHAVQLQPENGEYWYLLGKCLHKLFHCDAAVLAFEKAEALGFNGLSLKVDKAMALAVLNKYDEAQLLVDDMLEDNPDDVFVLQVQGVINEMMGNVDIAEESFRKIFKTLPAEPAILFRLSDMGRFTQEDYLHCNPAHPVFKRRSPLSDIDKSFLYFAKGKEDIKHGRHDAAFMNMLEGNSLIRKHYDYDRKNMATRTLLHSQVYIKELFELFKGAGSSSAEPVFIIGMPRSGTTLVEQILFSHPEISSAGEVTYISKIESNLVEVSKEMGTSYPQSMTAFDKSGLQDFADQYLAHLKKSAKGQGRYITDKMPNNFLNLGLICLLFPNAKIIHVKRNPLDTCVSCYFNRFVDLKNLSFTFDMSDLAHFYNEYLKLMKHWRSVVPDRFIEIEYEELIENQEQVTRYMLNYLNLPWDEQCMEFYNTDRGVATSSLYQVRKPIYKSSSGRWKNYEKHIGPLIEGLNLHSE